MPYYRTQNVDQSLFDIYIQQGLDPQTAGILAGGQTTFATPDTPGAFWSDLEPHSGGLDTIGNLLPIAFLAGFGGMAAGAGGAGAEGAAAGGTEAGVGAPGAAAGGGYDAAGNALLQSGTSGGGVGGATGAAAAMPAAIPETDPTFGGALNQTAPGVYAAPEAAAGGGTLSGLATPTGAIGAGTSALSASSGGSGGGGATSGGGSATAGGSGGGGLFDYVDDDTWLQMLMRGVPGLIGAAGASSQAEDFEDLANQYSNMGAPYRGRLAELYGNPEAFLNSPEVRAPIQQGTNMLARSLSVGGNPAGSGNALQELQNYTSNQLFSRLGQEKDRLGGFGGLTAYNQAAPQAAQNVIGAQGNVYSNLGGAAADIFNPPRRYRLEDFLRAY